MYEKTAEPLSRSTKQQSETTYHLYLIKTHQSQLEGKIETIVSKLLTNKHIPRLVDSMEVKP